MEFILNNYEAVGGIIVAAALIVYAIVTRQWSILRTAALGFMIDAERLIATVDGKAKMDMVFAAAWQQIPKWIKMFVTEETLREKLQEWYNIAKNSLSGI